MAVVLILKQLSSFDQIYVTRKSGNYNNNHQCLYRDSWSLGCMRGNFNHAPHSVFGSSPCVEMTIPGVLPFLYDLV